MSANFTYTLLLSIALTLGLFAAAEIFLQHRQTLAALAAVVEGFVFILLAVVLYRVQWGGGVPSWLFAAMALAGTAFAWRLAWRRVMGLEV
jgi:hypothetical protein